MCVCYCVHANNCVANIPTQREAGCQGRTGTWNKIACIWWLLLSQFFLVNNECGFCLGIRLGCCESLSLAGSWRSVTWTPQSCLIPPIKIEAMWDLRCKAEVRYHLNKDSNWRGPPEKGVCTYFAVIFQVARNPLKFGMPLFVLKNIHVFLRRQKIMRNIERKSPLLFLCLYPNNIGFRSLRAKRLCVCTLHYIWKGGGGGEGYESTFKNVFEALFAHL